MKLNDTLAGDQSPVQSAQAIVRDLLARIDLAQDFVVTVQQRAEKLNDIVKRKVGRMAPFSGRSPEKSGAGALLLAMFGGNGRRWNERIAPDPEAKTTLIARAFIRNTIRRAEALTPLVDFVRQRLQGAQPEIISASVGLFRRKSDSPVAAMMAAITLHLYNEVMGLKPAPARPELDLEGAAPDVAVGTSA